MKNKKQNKPTGKKRRSCLLKNKTCFERNEETVRLADSSVCCINAFTFETSHIDNKNLKTLDTVLSLICIY